MARTAPLRDIRSLAAIILLVLVVGVVAPTPAAASPHAPVAPASIERLYEAYFLRPADRSGLDYWVAQSHRGHSLAAISSHFAASAEFRGHYGQLDDAGFVDLVYRNVLARAPEREGLDYWRGMLRAGLDRGALMVGFSESPEFRALVERRRERPLEVTPAPTGPTTPPSRPSTSGFVHPGIVVGGEQLDFVRTKIAEGAQPWTGALDAIHRSGGSVKTDRRPASHRFSSLSYPPAPTSVIQAAGAGGSRYMEANPHLGFRNIGGPEHLDDARAAYTHALLWYFTGEQAHADKAIEIMDAWSSTLREIKFDQPRRPDNGGHLYDQGKLQAGWGGSLFSRAAEIIRHSDAGWAAADVGRFERMLTDVYLPLVITGWSNGANWLMTFAEATMGIGVFTEDRAAFDAGVAMWREKVPTTIYVPSDGARPVPPTPWYDDDQRMRKLWHDVSAYLPGLQAETARDMSHTMMGLGAMANAAETARLQGVDLYGEEQTRIVAGFERTAQYLNEYLDEVDRRGGQPDAAWRPSNWVGGTFDLGGGAWRGGWEVGFGHYQAEGQQMPQTTKLVHRLRPSSQAALHLSWETLTHAR